HVRGRDMFPVGREPIAHYFPQNNGPSFFGRFIAFQNKGGAASTGHEPVTVPIERTAGLYGIILIYGKDTKAIITAHGNLVYFLRPTTYNAILNSIFY